MRKIALALLFVVGCAEADISYPSVEPMADAGAMECSAPDAAPADYCPTKGEWLQEMLRLGEIVERCKSEWHGR